IFKRMKFSIDSPIAITSNYGCESTTRLMRRSKPLKYGFLLSTNSDLIKELSRISDNEEKLATKQIVDNVKEALNNQTKDLVVNE
ncbi:10687_t:CDS:2, partial [Dentiscutata heterogama]